jgi:hypothetical protein
LEDGEKTIIISGKRMNKVNWWILAPKLAYVKEGVNS